MKNVTYINAGAGSGKTYTLTKKLAEELSKNHVKPSQVILTTFTELAAAEFKEKAREQILVADNLEAAAQLDSAVIGTVHSMAYHFIQKFWYLLDYGADIQTISENDDEFYMNQSLARIVQEINPADGKLKYQKHLDIFNDFRDYFDISDGSRPNYLFWQPILREVVEKMEYYEVDDVQESINKSHDTIKHVYVGRFLTDPQLKKDLVDNLKVYSGFCNDLLNGIYKAKGNFKSKAQRHRDNALALANSIADPSFDLRVLYEQHRNSDNLLKDLLSTPSGGKIATDNCHEYFIFQDIITKEFHTSASHRDILMAFITSIFELAKAWRDDFKAYKQNNHIISYNDMEQLFLKLIIKEKEVKDYIKEHYRLIMVDEFQDSNPIQLKIFNQLSELIAPDGHSFWVGDPKQSIYGFRGADTELVNEVSQKFTFYDDDELHPEEGPNRLGTKRLIHSWRSRKGLVNLVNDFFFEPFKADRIDDKLIKLDPQFSTDHPEVTYKPLVHWECSESNASNAADALADKVKELLDSKIKVHHNKLDKEPSEIRPSDVAILCRTNSSANNVVKALRKIGVPVSEPEDSIMQRIEVQLVVTLLQFTQSPSNMHVRADLKRLLEGMKTEDILKNRLDYVYANDLIKKKAANQEVDDEWLDSDNLIIQLTKFTERLKHLSIPEMVDALIYECDIPALTAKWGDAPIRQQNLSTLRHLAANYDQRCLQLGLGASVNGFIYFLNSTEPDKEKDNHSDTVKVFTYHGAKGLEWSVVILHNLNNDALDDNDCIKKNFMRVREMVLTSTGDPFSKTYYLHYFPNTLKGKSISENPPEGLVEKLAGNSSFSGYPLYLDIKKKVRSEERRLMYVGMTRAKDRLISFGYKGKSSDEFAWLNKIKVDGPTADKMNQHQSISDDVWCNELHKPEYFTVTAPSATTTTSTTPTWEHVQKPQKHTERPNRHLSPSKIKEFEGGYNSFREWDERHEPMKGTDQWSKDYAANGSCIHDFFAVYQQGNNDRNRELAKSIIEGYGLPELKGNIDDFIKAADWLYKELEQRYPQNKETDHIETEVPFQATLPSGQTLRGEMDLLWFYTDKEGKPCCVLVDYKSFRGEKDYKPTKKYYPQLSAYAHALRKAGITVTAALLYYPVSGVVHELTSK